MQLLREKAIWLVSITCLFLLAGCNDNQAVGDDGELFRAYGRDELTGYVISDDSSTEIIHWFHINRLEPGISYLFSDGAFYIMATYEKRDFLDMEIQEIIFWDDRIMVKAVPGSSVLREDDPNEIDQYTSNVYRIENVEPVYEGPVNEVPYELVIFK